MANYDCAIFVGHGTSEVDGSYDPGATFNSKQEHIIAEKIVDKTVALCIQSGLNIHRDEQNYKDKDLVGNTYNYKYAISVHLNAGKGTRAELFSPCKEKSLTPEFNLLKNLETIGLNNGGVKSRDFDSGKVFIRENGSSINYTDYYKEIRDAWNLGVSLDIIEVGFIDSNDINIIENNIDKIAGYIAQMVCDVCNIPLEQKDPEWIKDQYGWWYKFSDGSYPKSKWELIDNVWYYFGNDGYAYCDGWRGIDNIWYYFDENCKMLSNQWIQDNNKWYYLNDNGSMAKGWKLINGSWYYLNDDGSMATNCEIDGWLLDANGVGTKKVQTSTPILGKPIVTKEQMLAWAKRKNNDEEYLRVMSLTWEMALELGIRPDVACSQVTKETGALYKNGSAAGLDSSYHNPCGLKITQGGGDYEASAHMKFPSWIHGLSAYLDHLALYIGIEGYPLSDTNTFDPRHFSYLKGTAKNVEDLSTKWCPSITYGIDILAQIDEMKK